MEVISKYEETAVSDIPIDWYCNTIESVTHPNIKNGIVDGPFGSNLKTIHYRKKGIPIISSGFVTEGRFYADSYIYVDKKKFEEEKRSAVNPGDIVMAKIGARCGASAILPASHPVGILSGNALKITVDESRHSTKYIWQVLWSLYSEGNVEALRTVGAQPAISMSVLKKHKILLPPLTEQRLISTALSDVDALLDSLDRLIAKTRNLKQAAMQQLLTGQIRLPGFSREWEVKQLDEIADVFKGSSLSKSSITPTGLYPCILYGELFTSYRRVINKIFSRTNLREGLLSIAGDVLLPASTTTTGADLATASALLIDDVALGGDILVIRKKGEKYDSVFLASYLSHTAKHQIAELTQGITIHHLYGKSLKTLLLHIPSLPEQTAIATALNEMDTELTALEQRRNKTAALKQGMMQELLTGRTRLV